jgi:translation elongation factor EF-Tu-like GTPase
MRVEDTTEFMDNRTLVTGIVMSGSVHTGDELFVHGAPRSLKVRVTGVEAFAKSLDFAKVGDRTGLILDGIYVADIPTSAELLSIADGTEPTDERVPE